MTIKDISLAAASRMTAALTGMHNGLSSYDSIGAADMDRIELLAYAAYVTGALYEATLDMAGDEFERVVQAFGNEIANGRHP